MSYKFLEHQADIGILAKGKTIEESFSEGAKAMFEVMVDLNKVKPAKTISIECKADTLENLFIEWLNELLAQQDIHDFTFSKFELKIKENNNKFSLKGKAYGEPLNQKKHNIKTEVKAATYSGLKVWRKGKIYKAQCVLDI